MSPGTGAVDVGFMTPGVGVYWNIADLSLSRARPATTMTRSALVVVCVVLATLGLATAKDPERIQTVMRNFYEHHPVARVFAPFARAVLQSDHPRLFRLAGIAAFVMFTLAAVGILILPE